MIKSKQEILVEIKNPYRIKSITGVFTLIVFALTFMIIIGAVKNFGRELTSDIFGALLNLYFAWNVGFGLYKVIWQFWNSRKINKALFPRLEQFINESEEKSYDETEAEVDEMVKLAYSDYTEKYNKLNKMYWLSFKVSSFFPLIALLIWFVYLQIE